MLSASDFKPGVCSICGNAALLKWRDCATGQSYGACCLPDALSADRALSLAEGLRHPTLEESSRRR